MKLGRKVAIIGNAIRRATATTNAARKGNIPLKMVSIGTPCAIPLMTYTFTPTGGVITPISVTRTIITPNQIGSNPAVAMTGR